MVSNNFPTGHKHHLLASLGVSVDASDVLNGRRLDPNGTLTGLGLRIAMPVDSIGLYGAGGVKAVFETVVRR